MKARLILFSLIALSLAGQTASANLIFSDNFESGSLANWSFASPAGTFATNTIQYGIETIGSNNVLSMSGGVAHPGGGGGTLAAMVAPASPHSDYVISADMHIVDFINGGSHHALLGRVQDESHHYEFTLQSETHLGNLVTVARLVRWDGPTSLTIIAAESLAVPTGTWVNMRAEFAGDRINAYLNDQLLMSVQDATYSSGGFGLMNAGGHTHFDNFRVTAVPEPSSMVLFGMSWLAFVGYGVRRRR